MALESLFEDAFRRGCGISRSYALRTPRYRELSETFPHVAHTQQHEAAEMAYLGERIADRAFLNLPKYIRDRALQWQDMDEVRQHQLLNALMTRLTSKRWINASESRRKLLYNTVSSALPAQYGHWSRGKSQPNCLGMTQMLIGFARATGADHLMVDTLIQHDYYREEQFYLMVTQMLKKLNRHRADPGIAQIIRRLETKQHFALRMLAQQQQRHQAHHALAIKVGSNWVLVDPYLGTKYNLDAVTHMRTEIYQEMLSQPRRRRMLLSGRQLRTDQRMALIGLEHAVKAYAKRNRPLKKYSGLVEPAAAGSAFAWMGVELGRNELTEKELEDAMAFAEIESILTRSERKEWNETNGRPKTFTASERVRHIARSKRARNAMLKRLVRYAATTCLVANYNHAVSRKAEHRLVELAHPTFHLAVMTLNHLAGHTGLPAIELLRFSSSQWIIHDTLGEVAASEDAKMQRILETSLRRIEKYPYMMLPELLAHHEHRNEEVDGT